MSSFYLEYGEILHRLRQHMQTAGYHKATIDHWCARARQFLDFLLERCIRIDDAQPAHVAMYMRRELSEYLRRHGRMPANRKRGERGVQMVWSSSFV